MKNRNLLMHVKSHTNNLFFYGCKWSMLITAYALIAIIIVMSSESYFSEGVYAAEVAYSTKAYDFTEPEDVLCMGLVLPEEEEDCSALSVKAYEENESSSQSNKLEQAKAERINVSIADSVANDPARKIVEKAKKKKVRKETKNSKKTIEAFQGAGSSTRIKLSSSEKNVLMRIVEAEATGEDIKGKMLVANVVLNRVNSSHFPDTVEQVVFQKNGSVYQFSPIKDGRYYKVNISEDTKKAVKRVLNGEDESKGALYFMSRSMAKASSVTWFDRSLTKVLKHGTHEFYK